jgi:hypothetical protein
MTEREWLECADPSLMLEFLGGRASERKRRLFDAACCEELREFLEYPESERAIEVARRQADGLVSPEELLQAAEAAYRAACQVQQDTEGDDPFAPLHASDAVWLLLADEEDRRRWGSVPYQAAADALGMAALDQARPPNVPEWWGGLARLRGSSEEEAVRQRGRAAARKRQAVLLREVFGNPFRPTPTPILWRTPTVTEIAQGIYHEEAFDRLPILGDALEEAGCSDEAILSHCREVGAHVRGCWVVDLILGKE